MRLNINKAGILTNKKASSFAVYGFALILVIFIAIFLRFYNLTERGLIYYDEGYYANQAKFILLSLIWGKNNIDEIFSKGINLDNLWSFVNENGGTFPHTRKPGHDLLNAFGFLIFGIHDWSLFIMSALFGTGTVILVFMLCKDFYNVQSGLVACAILAVSNLHIWFSRSAMAQASATCFVILGIYLYFKSFQENIRSTKKLLLAGLCIGFALTIHPNLFLVPIILFISDGFFLIKKWMSHKEVKEIFKSAFFGLFILIPLFIFQMPYFMLKTFYGEKLASISSKRAFSTYLDEIFFISNNVVGRLSLGSYFNGKVMAILRGYLENLWVSEEVPVMIFAIIGSAYLFQSFFKKRDQKNLLLLLLLFCPLFFWGLSGVAFRLRLIYIILPVLSITAGIGAKFVFDAIQDKFSILSRLSDALLLIFIIFILGSGSYKAKAILNLKTKPIYRELEYSLINHIDKNGGILTDKQGHFYPIMRFYLGNLINRLPEKFHDHIILSSQITKSKNIPYYGDYIIMLGDEWKDPPAGEFIRKKIKGCNPIISLDYPITFTYSDKFLIDQGKTRALKVFDLRRCKL